MIIITLAASSWPGISTAPTNPPDLVTQPGLGTQEDIDSEDQQELLIPPIKKKQRNPKTNESPPPRK